MSEAQIRIGIGGWTYPPWRGVFYPDKLAAIEGARICVAPARRDRDQRDFLRPAEAEKLGNLGEDRSRRLPVRDQGLALLRHAVASCAKARKGIGNFFAQGFAALGPKLGPILWQFARAPEVRPRRHRRLHRPAAGDARRHRAAPRDRAAPRKLQRRAILRALPRAQHRRRVRGFRRLSVHRSRHGRLRLRPAAADERGRSDRL